MSLKKSLKDQCTMEDNTTGTGDAAQLCALTRRGNHSFITITDTGIAARVTTLKKSPNNLHIDTTTDFRTHLRRPMKKPLDCSLASAKSSSILPRAKGSSKSRTSSDMMTITMRNLQPLFTS